MKKKKKKLGINILKIQLSIFLLPLEDRKSCICNRMECSMHSLDGIRTEKKNTEIEKKKEYLKGSRSFKPETK